ncbi:hypothetical protein Psp6_00047 [Pseudomonas phage Psp6]|nr:hypothetical protein Psp6_00047 [Pseudomonas phage Psp6]
MPTRLALTGFMHGSQKFKRNEPVTFDQLTIDRLERAGLVGKDDRPDLAPPVVGVAHAGDDGTFLLQPGEKVISIAPTDTVDTSKPSRTTNAAKPRKGGKKPSVLPAVPASTPPTLPPLQPGVPPPLPDAK